MTASPSLFQGTIGVTGATGQFGRLAIAELLRRGVAARNIIGLARDPAKASDLSRQGIQVRQADYEKPDTLRQALRGVERLLLVSANEVGRRALQHRNVIDAAKQAGVRSITYTSLAHAERSKTILGKEHHETEQALRASGIPHTVLRNSWYLENYTDHLGSALQHGAILGSAGNGRVSAATRADYAGAAATVLTGTGHEGRIYELGGDEAFTLPELASWVSELSGRPVAYRDLPQAEYAATLASFGLPKNLADALADADAGLAGGDLHVTTGDLKRLLGRPTTPAKQAIQQALAALPTAKTA